MPFFYTKTRKVVFVPHKFHLTTTTTTMMATSVGTKLYTNRINKDRDETYEDILATFTVTERSNGNKNTTRPTTAPDPIPLQPPTDTTTEERQGNETYIKSGTSNTYEDAFANGRRVTVQL